MLKSLAKIRASLVRSLEVLVMIIMAVLVLDVMWQVITRMASGIPQDIITINPEQKSCV